MCRIDCKKTPYIHFLFMFLQLIVVYILLILGVVL